MGFAGGLGIEHVLDRAEEAARGTEGVVDGTGFVAAVDHAVLATLVPALLAVAGPVGGVDQFLEGIGVAVAEEIAGFLPAEDVEGGVAPGGAVVVDFALEEGDEVRRVVELPGFLGVAENLGEEGLGAVALEENFLLGGLGVGIAGGDHHALDAELGHVVEELANTLGLGGVENGGVRRDAETTGDGLADGGDGDVVGAVAANGFVVLFLHAVHVDGEGELLVGGEEVELAFEKESVRAEINVAALGDEAVDDFLDFRVNERFAAGDADNGGTAFVGRGEGLLGGDALLEDVLGILNLAAAFALQIATEQGLEHEHERVAFHSADFLSEDVGADFESLGDGNGHN